MGIKNIPDGESLEELYSEGLKTFNSPFDVRKIMDNSPHGMENSKSVFRFNNYLQKLNEEIKIEITDELFEQRLKDWLKEEFMEFDEETFNYLKKKLIFISARFFISESKKEKKWLLRLRKFHQDKQAKLSRLISKNPELIKSEKYSNSEKQNTNLIFTISPKGKNFLFMLQEVLTIYEFHQITKYSFEKICALLAFTYNFFSLLPKTTNQYNYAHSLKTNIFQFRQRKREEIFKLIEMDKDISPIEYEVYKHQIDQIVNWIKSII